MAVWDAAFEQTPTGASSPAEGDDRIREIKSTVRDRLTKEHFMDLSEAGIQPRQGLHREGSALGFYQASAPTQRNGVALSTADRGLIWNNSSNSDLLLWSGTAWQSVFGSNVGFRGTDMDTGNADTLVVGGTYMFRPGATGTPSSSYWFIIHSQVVENYAMQTACEFSNSIQYIRRQYIGVWSPWTRIANYSDIPITLTKFNYLLGNTGSVGTKYHMYSYFINNTGGLWTVLNARIPTVGNLCPVSGTVLISTNNGTLQKSIQYSLSAAERISSVLIHIHAFGFRYVRGIAANTMNSPEVELQPLNLDDTGLYVNTDIALTYLMGGCISG